MNDLLSDVLPENPDCECQQSTEEKTAKRGRKNKETVAEFISTKVKLRLLRDAFLDGNTVLAGSIVEVDEVTATDLLKKLPVPASFYGYRPGNVQETIARAERII